MKHYTDLLFIACLLGTAGLVICSATAFLRSFLSSILRKDEDDDCGCSKRVGESSPELVDRVVSTHHRGPDSILLQPQDDHSRVTRVSATFEGTICCEDTIINYFDMLPDHVLEMILANIPAIDIFCCQSVCNRWYSVTTSPSFRSSFHKLSTRLPWFLLLDTNQSSPTLQPEAVINTEAPGAWCQINLQIPIPTSITARTHNVVFSSGGLICVSGGNRFFVCNPFTGSSHGLTLLSSSDAGHYVKGIAMHASSYSENAGGLSYQIFVLIVKKVDDTRVLQIKTYASSLRYQGHRNWTNILQLNLDDQLLHPLSSGRIAGVTTIGREGQILLHFISGDGSTAICCDTHSGTICMTQKISQSCKASELVVCDGTLFAVILSGNTPQPLAPTQLQIYEYLDDTDRNTKREWKHVTTMPKTLPKMCHNGKDHYHAISCAGYGDYIMVYVTCASSKFTTSSYAAMFNNKKKAWVPLSPYWNPLGPTGLTQKMEICSLMPDID